MLCYKLWPSTPRNFYDHVITFLNHVNEPTVREKAISKEVLGSIVQGVFWYIVTCQNRNVQDGGLAVMHSFPDY